MHNKIFHLFSIKIQVVLHYDECFYKEIFHNGASIKKIYNYTIDKKNKKEK